MSQAEAYSDVQIFTGVPQQQDATGFFQPTIQTADGMLAADQARAVAEVQAALVIAASRPRNELRARDKLLQACQRGKLAESATYQYKRGGSSVTGPSIRLAEAAARAWGNMNYGFREVSRRPGESECEAYAWDLETNTKAVRQFTVRHRRDTRQGGKDVTEERDIYEVMASQAQRRVRAVILEIIPGDIMEDAVYECQKTMTAKVGDIHEAAAKLVAAFEAFGVTRAAIEKRLGHRLDAIQAAQILAFRRIYTSLNDGMSEPKDWFEMNVDQEATAPEKPKRARKKAQELPPTEAAGETVDVTPEPARQPDPQTAQEMGDEPPLAIQHPEEYPGEEVGETRNDDDEDDRFYSGKTNGDSRPPNPGDIECPDIMPNGQHRIVTEADCKNCKKFRGCPNWT